MTFAVVPAAGASTRMGRCKLTLPLAGRSVIEHVVTTLRAGGVGTVVVVTGPHFPEVAARAASVGADVVALEEPTPDMRATLDQGLQRLAEHGPSPEDPWLLAPADHPAFTAETVRSLLAARGPLVTPSYTGRRGHPVLLRWRHVRDLRAFPAGQGINAFLRLRADEIRELPVPDAGILVNLDTDDDYQQLLRRSHASDSPPAHPSDTIPC